MDAVAVSGTAPTGTTSVALAVDSAEGRTTFYPDNASLRGFDRFIYGRPAPSIKSVTPDHGNVGGGTIVTL
jgi:hypothetical protein